MTSERWKDILLPGEKKTSSPRLEALKKRLSVNAPIPALLLSPLIVAITLLVVYALRGIYPFGNGNVYYYDMPQYMIPMYYRTWDVMHGVKSAFFDWDAGMGASMMDVLGGYILHPSNLFFLLIKRSDVTNSMSVFLLLKFSFIAFGMSFYTHRTYRKLPWIYHVIAGLGYASCGYVLQYYTVPTFLDYVGILPILIYFLDRLIHEKKVVLYCIVMTIGFFSNFYMMYMICLFIILYVGLNTRLMEKTERKKVIWLLAITTMVALLVSFFSWGPGFLSIIHSERVGRVAESDGYFGVLKRFFCYERRQKQFMIYGSEFFAALVLFSVIRKKIIKLGTGIILMFFMLSPIVVEGINQMWHPGGYAQFPMRFGFMITFEALSLLLSFLEENDCWVVLDSAPVLRKTCGYLALASSPFVAVVLFSFIQPFQEYGIREFSVYTVYPLIAVLVATVYLFAFFSKSKGVVLFSLSTVIFIQMSLGFYGLIGPDKEYSPECEDELLHKAILMEVETPFQKEAASRSKNLDNSVITNYPFVSGVSALSGWAFSVEKDARETLTELGYSESYTRLLDNGGTEFTDSILGMQTAFSTAPANESLYTFCKNGSNLDYYERKYTIPFGFVKRSELESAFTEDVFDNQNKLFKDVTGFTDDLIEERKVSQCPLYEVDEIKDGYEISFELPVSDEKTLYFYSVDEIALYQIIINGEKQKLPYLTETDNDLYPVPFLNGSLERGTYKDETIHIELKVECAEEVTLSEIENDFLIGLMDMNLLQKGCEELRGRQNVSVSFGKRNLHIEGETFMDGYLFLPVAYMNGWKWKDANGNVGKPEPALHNTCMMIPVEKGRVDLEVTFFPPGFSVCFAVSVITCVVSVLCYSCLIRKKKFGSAPVGLLHFTDVLFSVVFWSIIVVYYVVPICAWIYLTIRRIRVWHQ